MDLAPEDQVGLPIADAAWDVQQIEPSSAISGEFEISLGEPFTDPASRTAFARRVYTETLRTYRLRDVTLDASYPAFSRSPNRSRHSVRRAW